MQTKDILSMMEFTSKDVDRFLNIASKLKKRPKPLLKGRAMAMIFQKPSTRTRVSFEVAMLQLGGHAINLSMNDIQLARGETIEDTARTLSRYVDVIGARVKDHSDVVRLAEASKVPVINMLSDMYHPCQTLGDLLTIKEVKRKLKGLKLAWVGDGNNVCNSLMIGCALTGINAAIACPAGYGPHSEALQFVRREGPKNKCVVEITEDPREAVKGADVIYTDAFVSMGKESERDARMSVFLPKYQVNAALMKLAKSDAIFMHCLPAKRGEEVTDDVIDGRQSVVWQEAENRLHAQKSLLCLLLLTNLKGL